MYHSRSNLVQSAQLVLDALPFLKLELPADRQADVAHIQSIEVNDLQILDPTTQRALVNLWASEPFKEAVSYGQSFQLNDSATCKRHIYQTQESVSTHLLLPYKQSFLTTSKRFAKSLVRSSVSSIVRDFDRMSLVQTSHL